MEQNKEKELINVLKVILLNSEIKNIDGVDYLDLSKNGDILILLTGKQADLLRAFKNIPFEEWMKNQSVKK